MNLRKRGSFVAILLAAAMTVSSFNGLALDVHASDADGAVVSTENTDSVTNDEETEETAEAEEVTEAETEPAQTDQLESASEESAAEENADESLEDYEVATAVDALEEGEFVFNIIGEDDNQQDLLNAAFHETKIKEKYLLLAKVKDEEDEDVYTYQPVNPAEDYSKYEDLLVYYFDEDGQGSVYTKTAVVPVSWYVWKDDDSSEEAQAEITDDLYYLVDGLIDLSSETREITLQEENGEKSYSVEPNGKATEITETQAVETATVTNTYIVSDGYLYYVDANGKSTVYIKSKTTAGTYAKKVSGKYYKVSYKTGKATLINGVYKNQLFVKGVKYTGTATKGFVVDGYFYKVLANGKATKYIKNTTAASYRKLGFALDGRRYIYTVITKTAKATLYIKNKNKSGNYVVVNNAKAYEISYSTGRVMGHFTGIHNGKLYKDSVLKKFTGVYKGYYFADGIVKTAAAKYYVIYKNYIYLVQTNGSAAVYIRKKGSTKKYTYDKGGYRYTIEYATGKVVSSKKLSETARREKLVSTALTYLGFYENTTGAKSHRKIVDLYNSYTPRARNYKVSYTDAWCATYVSAMFIKLKWTKIFPVECSCYYQVAAWKKLGRWVEKDSYVPKAGDIIYYNWSDSGSGDCKGTPNHVGIVESVSASNVITVIEGNKTISSAKGDGVAKRTIKVNGRFIRGYAKPNYTGL